MQIKIRHEQYKRAIQFANDRIDKSKALYNYRGESKVSKMIEDIVVGTVGEFAVAKYLRQQGLDCSRPDLKIYEAKRKSFEQDLLALKVLQEDPIKCKQFKIHVKSQSVASSKRYGNSWLLQKSDKVTKDPGNNEYYAFTEVDGLNVTILGVVKCSDVIKHGLLSECKVPWYRDTKHALYWMDFEEKLSKKQLRRL